MKEQGKIFERFVLGADLPAEPIPGQPIIEIVGGSRVIIENHNGITMYGCKEICVKVRIGFLCVCGNELELVYMTKQQLVITGRIDSVFVRRGGK